MKISFLKAALVLSLIFNFSVLGAAGYFYFTKDGNRISPFGVKATRDKFLFEELSLRPYQMKRLRERAIPFRTEIDAKRREIATKRDRLLDLMRVDPPDEHAIKSAIAEISGIQAEMEEMVATHILRMEATLDKDQRKRFLDLIQEGIKEGRLGCAPIAPD
jgi:Spy/CpxP family protein refolding chaperone